MVGLIMFLSCFFSILLVDEDLRADYDAVKATDSLYAAFLVILQ